MPVNITIAGSDATEALLELKRLGDGLVSAAPSAREQIEAAIAKQPPAEAAETDPELAASIKAAADAAAEAEASAKKAAEPEKSGEAERSVEAPSDAPDLDTNDVRGCIALVNACKDMTAARGLLSKFEAKKVSDIDKKHYGELVEQTAELLGVEYGPALRGAKVTMLLTKLADDDDGKALKEKFGGEGALTISDEDFDALEKAAG